MDNNFIISGQKFIAMPKNLLLFAQNQSSTFTGGSGVAVDVDTITEVQRNDILNKFHIRIWWAVDSSFRSYKYTSCLVE